MLRLHTLPFKVSCLV